MFTVDVRGGIKSFTEKTHLFELVGHRCFDHLDSESESAGYAGCMVVF